MPEIIIKVKAGRYMKPVKLDYQGKRIFVSFKYNKTLIAEIKSMQGARWHGFDDPPRPIWSIENCARNSFQLEYLQGLNPYERFDRPLVDVVFDRNLYDHQKLMTRFALTRHYCIFACEMGTGKTLSAIEVIERAGVKGNEVWYVGPKAGVKAVKLELGKWKSKVIPEMMTYDRLVTIMNTWSDGMPAPKIVIFDESSKIKTPSAQRSQAALHLANAVREEHGENGYIIEMSGTPAPKSPVDWWNQCEVACPGFLREGQVNKFKSSLCIIEERQSITGGVYPHLITWLDDSNKCKVCGQLPDHTSHSEMERVMGTGHTHEPSINEVDRLYKRMSGLVLVQFKKDCLDLPDKQYRIIYAEPTAEMLRAAKMIKRRCGRAIQALTLLRELSDGFQYAEEVIGEEHCPNCAGKGIAKVKVLKQEIDIMAPQEVKEDDYEIKDLPCDVCGGEGEVKQYRRITDSVTSPKDEVFIEQLDQHEEEGRLIVWGGFTGTVDRLVDICHRYGWSTLRVDGRGYIGATATGDFINDDELLIAMDRSHPRFKELLEKHPKLCFVGHPEAGGMALTLTASPTEIFYSNSFKGEARMQAEDRFHRPGMDSNRGATVIDIIHLPTDRLVLDNLRKKKRLQDLSMGELNDVMEGERVL